MTEHKRQHDQEPDFAVSPQFSADLGEAFGPTEAVPTEVDRAVAEAVRRHFARPQRRFRLFRWAVPATAVAAVIVVASVWWTGHGALEGPADRLRPQASRPPLARRVASEAERADVAGGARADIDRNGRVDILDAFTLARHVESAGRMNETWDINGDGSINRDDVDAVAFAAVRLNRGV